MMTHIMQLQPVLQQTPTGDFQVIQVPCYAPFLLQSTQSQLPDQPPLPSLLSQSIPDSQNTLTPNQSNTPTLVPPQQEPLLSLQHVLTQIPIKTLKRRRTKVPILDPVTVRFKRQKVRNDSLFVVDEFQRFKEAKEDVAEQKLIQTIPQFAQSEIIQMNKYDNQLQKNEEIDGNQSLRLFSKQETESISTMFMDNYGRNKKINTSCPHSDKKHYAKNMCLNCYHKKGRQKKAWACQHTSKTHYAKGMCQSCYLQNYHANLIDLKKIE